MPSNVQNIIQAAIVAGVSAATASPATAATPADNAIITASVASSVAPLIANATNSEPWYQSHVTIGAIVSIVIPVLSLVGIKANVITADQLTAIITAAGVLVGGLVTLYGRWVAKKPLGS